MARSVLGVLLASLLFAGAVEAQSPSSVTLELPNGGIATISVDASLGHPSVSASSLEVLHWTEEAGSFPDELVLRHRTGVELRFRSGSPFLTWDGRLLQTAHPATRTGDDFLLPLQLVVDLFPRLLPGAYRWDAARFVLQVEGAWEADGIVADADPGDLPAPPPGAGDAAPPAPPVGDLDAMDVDAGAPGVEDIEAGGELLPGAASFGDFPAPPPPFGPDDGRRAPWVVVIDPGHGGEDPGATGSGGVREKDVVLAMALALARELSRGSDLEVRVTRDRDVGLPLPVRGAWAEEWRDGRPGVLLSLHLNALPDRPGVRGFETHFPGEARDEHERAVAALENASLRGAPGAIPVGDALTEAVLRELADFDHAQGSALLASEIQRELSRFHPGTDRGVKRAPFALAAGVHMPTAVVLLGFITNPEEERLLARPEFHREAAEAMARAVRSYLERTYASGDD